MDETCDGCGTTAEDEIDSGGFMTEHHDGTALCSSCQAEYSSGDA